MSSIELLIALGFGMGYIVIGIILDQLGIISTAKIAAKGLKYQVLLGMPVLLSMFYILLRLYIIPGIKELIDRLG